MELSPATVVVPVVRDLTRLGDVAATFVEPVPVLDGGRAVPLPIDVHDDPDRVLKRAIPAWRNDVGPSVRTILLAELQMDPRGLDIQPGDHRRHRPVGDV